MKFRLALIALIVIFLVSRSFAGPETDASSARYEISREAVLKIVAATLRQNRQEENDAFSSADLHLPQGLTSKEKSPALEVVGTRWNVFAHEWQVSMRCQERSSCASFLVLLKQKNYAGIPNPFKAFHFSKTSSSGKAEAKFPVVVQPGKSATLIMESSDTRITLPVVCLQRGVLNQWIDTRDRETKRILRAKVIGPGQLQASF